MADSGGLDPHTLQCQPPSKRCQPPAGSLSCLS
jgi:hypothetical protein